MNLAVSAAALVLASLSFLAYDRITARTNLVDSLSTQAQIIASNSISAIVFNDAQSAEKTLAALKNSPNVDSAGILTTDGRLFAEYWKDPKIRATVLPRIDPDRVETYSFTTNHLMLVRIIEFEGKRLGSIYIRSDLASIDQRSAHFVRILAMVLLASMMTALLASTIIGRTVAKPIMQLADTARTVSRDRNYSLRAKPTGDNDEIDTLIVAFNEMLSQIQKRDVALRSAHDELEHRVELRTTQLRAVNRELEAFSYSVSHDLRGPLEIVSNMSYIVQLQYGEHLDANGRDYLSRIQQAAVRMSHLIDDLLNLARVTKAEMHLETVDLSAMAGQVVAELREREPKRNVVVAIQPNVTVRADSHLLRAVMDNLLGNAWKYTSNKERSEIEFGTCEDRSQQCYFVKDNGAGFDPRAASRLFQAFQRLHPLSEFPGTGIGLATVQRIIQKHGGQVWAEGEVGTGATFYFTLP